MPEVIRIHRATIVFPDGTLFARIRLADGSVAEDNQHPLVTSEDAKARELQLAEEWKRANCHPEAIIEFCN